MLKPMWNGLSSRKILQRIVIEATLELLSPAHFGNGDADDLTDMPLLVDAYDGRSPLLTGASIAGALRGYLRERVGGCSALETSIPEVAELFGGRKGDDKGEQSPLIIEDAVGLAPGGDGPGVATREGVKIDPASRTATHKGLYNREVWEAGTTFPLRFELVVREGDDAKILKQILATALSGLRPSTQLNSFLEEMGRSARAITAGARRTRGYGTLQTSNWRSTTYDLTDRNGLLAWLWHGADTLSQPAANPDTPRSALTAGKLLSDKRRLFMLAADFDLVGSMLVRSGGGKDDAGPDMVHLHSRQADSSRVPVAPGTSIAGALRARARKIANTLDQFQKAQSLVNAIFGSEMGGGDTPRASRLRVRECKIADPVATKLVQNRVSIDRFTGGTRHGALFNEQPAFAKADTMLRIEIQLWDPQPSEIGLLMLLLKDLWLEDLPVGGESSVGRGRLRGHSAVLLLEGVEDPGRWAIKNGDDALQISGSPASQLEAYVSDFHSHLVGGSQ